MTFADVPYLPEDPKTYQPNIGVIGCGGISRQHLRAYKDAGYKVTALSDLELERAQTRQAEYFPEARVTTDYHELLADENIEVVDVTTHPKVRVAIIEAALNAGKHVLSQKPFVLDLDDGERLVRLAEERGLKLAVNQNGRWSPQFSYIRQAVGAGLLGDIKSLSFNLQFDHNWTLDTPFNDIHHLILYDYAIHWFDFINVLMGERAKAVYAAVEHSSTQVAKPPLLAHAAIHYPNALVTLAINGDATLGSSDQTQVLGSKAAILSEGPDLNSQSVTVTHADGSYQPELTGQWMPDGFHGTMGELLCAIEEDRVPSNNAKQNLSSLELCFAALKSADTGRVVQPGEVRRLKG